MGITGLLQNLKSVSEKTHLGSLRGCKVAIDGYSWLHKGSYYHGKAICEGQFTDGYVKFFLGRVNLLISYGITPIVVFDGCRLPSKEEEEFARRKSREENLAKARALMKVGNAKAAFEFYNRAVDISSSMAKVVIEHLRELNVSWVVSPYEADAQMAFLALHGQVDIVITEDSDMLAYGCPKVLFKLDKDGWGMLVQNRNLGQAKEIAMAGWDAHMFLTMCIMSGCDFLDNIPGVGIKTAAQLVQQFRAFANIIKDLRARKRVVPSNYEIQFQRAVWVFRHQRVWNPSEQRLTHLRPLPPGGIAAADVDVPAVLDLLRAAETDTTAAAICEASFGSLREASRIATPPPGLSDWSADGLAGDVCSLGNTLKGPCRSSVASAVAFATSSLSLPLDFLGPSLPSHLASGICSGDVDPHTMQPFDLHTVFQGWKNLPSHVRALLAGPPRSISTAPRRASWALGDGEVTAPPSQRESGAAAPAAVNKSRSTSGLAAASSPSGGRKRKEVAKKTPSPRSSRKKSQQAAAAEPSSAVDADMDMGDVQPRKLSFFAASSSTSVRSTSLLLRGPIFPEAFEPSEKVSAVSVAEGFGIEAPLSTEGCASRDSDPRVSGAFSKFVSRTFTVSAASMRRSGGTHVPNASEKHQMLTASYGGDKARRAALESCRAMASLATETTVADAMGVDVAADATLETYGTTSMRLRSSKAGQTTPAVKQFVPPRMLRNKLAGAGTEAKITGRGGHDSGESASLLDAGAIRVGVDTGKADGGLHPTELGTRFRAKRAK